MNKKPKQPKILKKAKTQPEITELLKLLRINYRNLDLYKEALTHSSFVNEYKIGRDYQRLEFLGDAIIEMCTSVFVFKYFNDFNEGQMSLIRTKNVNKTALSKLSQNLDIGKYILLGKGALIEDKINQSSSLLEDVFEALVAAIFLDLGMQSVNRFLDFTLYQAIRETELGDLKHSKTKLQELVQSEKNSEIYYQDLPTSTGSFHSKVFINGIEYGQGYGKTKKMAEEAAATAALSKLATTIF